MNVPCFTHNAPERSARSRLRFAGVMALMAFPFAAGAAELTLDTSQKGGNDLVTIPVVLETGPGEEISGAEFHLVYDPDRLELDEIVPGPAAKAAKKDVHFGRRSANEGVVLVMGLNQNPMADGTIAVCRFRQAKGNDSIEGAVRLRRATLSDPYGTPIPVSLRMQQGERQVAADAASPAGTVSGDGNPFSGAGPQAALLVAVIGLCAAAFYTWQRRRMRVRRR